jgi:hypothetical protein
LNVEHCMSEGPVSQIHQTPKPIPRRSDESDHGFPRSLTTSGMATPGRKWLLRRSSTMRFRSRLVGQLRESASFHIAESNGRSRCQRSHPPTTSTDARSSPTRYLRLRVPPSPRIL